MQSKLILGFVLLTFACITTAQPGQSEFARRISNAKTIDEKIAIAGNLKHGRANPRGGIEMMSIINVELGNNRKTRDGKGMITQYDIAEELKKKAIRLPRCPRLRGNERTIQKNGCGNRRGELRRTKRKAVKDNGSNRWPGAIVNYQITGSFTGVEMSNINDAIADIENRTCVTFQASSTEAYRLNIIKGSGCYSYVGRISSGNQPQELSLGNGCATSGKGITIHELFHALGAFHEQSRTDRDTKITVNFANIIPGRESNFNKKTTSQMNLFSTAYSFESIMHYGRTAFSVNGQDTITTLDPTKQNVIGQRGELSFEDIQLINRMYPCSVHKTPTPCPAANCPADGFQGRDCSCYCKVNGDPQLCTAPICTSPNQACGCTGASSCSNLPSTTCNTGTGVCECPSGWVVTGNTCTDPSVYLVMSDGSSVAPFINAASNTQFQPTTDAADQMAFGISANQMALVASKSECGYAYLESPVITQPGTYCFEYTGKLSNAIVWTTYQLGGASWSYTGNYLLNYGTDTTYNPSATDSVTLTSGSLKFSADAYCASFGSWSAALDNIRVYSC